MSYGDGEIRLFNVKDGENTTVLNAVVRNFKQQEVDFLDQAVTEQMRFPITMLRLCSAKVSQYSYKCITNFLSMRNKICNADLP